MYIVCNGGMGVYVHVCMYVRTLTPMYSIPTYLPTYATNQSMVQVINKSTNPPPSRSTESIPYTYIYIHLASPTSLPATLGSVPRPATGCEMKGRSTRYPLREGTMVSFDVAVGP